MDPARAIERRARADRQCRRHASRPARTNTSSAIAPRGRSAFLPDFDELYWNATGNGWDFRHRSGRGAHHAAGAGAVSSRTRSTPARRAPQGKDATVVEQRPGRIVFRTTRPLPPHNGLTVAAGWQKGLIEPPTSTQQARYWLEDNAALAVAIVGIALLLAYYALRLVEGRPRSAVGRHHPIVRSAGRHVPRRHTLCRPDGLRRSLLRRLDHQSRRERASEDRRQRQEADAAASRRRHAVAAEEQNRGRRSCSRPVTRSRWCRPTTSRSATPRPRSRTR